MTAQKNDDENMTRDNEEDLTNQPVLDPDDAGTGAESDDPVDRLESELHAAQIEAVEARQDMLRMQADMDNLRKRLVREHEKSRLRTLERFMNDFVTCSRLFRAGTGSSQ